MSANRIREHVRAERFAAFSFLVVGLAAAGLATVYALGGEPQLEGALIGITFGALGVGLVLIAHGLFPKEPFVEPRDPLGAGEPERAALERDIERMAPVSRRRLLRTALLGAGAAIAAAAAFPIRSLGPSPGRSLLETPWRGGRRAITEDGRPVRASDVPLGGLVTVFPEGHPGSADGQAVLVRVRERELRRAPGPRSWTPGGLIALSKVCTHAGCPVGLYQATTHQLLCPCHQSAFDVLGGGKPVFGPAARGPAAAAPRDRRRRLRPLAWRLRRPDRSGLVEPAVTRGGAARIAFVTAFVLALAACSGASPSAVHPAGSESREIARVWWLMFGLAVAVYVVVASFIVWSIVRGRRKSRAGARFSDDRFIWLGGVIVPAIILFVLGVVTVTTSNAIRKPSASALTVNVKGELWWWDVSYPDRGVRTANEIHVPVDTPIDVRLTSDNVIHSFWVPELAGKEDAIPGQPNHLRFTVEKTGVYRGLCAEFCGLQHAHMGFSVIAESPGDFGRWIERQARSAAEPVSDLAERGQLVFTSAACAGCHTIRGTTATGTAGPDLTHVASRRTIGAETVENTPRNLRSWVDDPGRFKPGALMPPSILTHDDLEAVVAYLETRK